MAAQLSKSQLQQTRIKESLDYFYNTLHQSKGVLKNKEEASTIRELLHLQI